MIFKKKTEIEIETKDDALAEKLLLWTERYESLKSDHRLKKIDDARFLMEEQIISDEIAELEKEKNLQAFDDMMGHPMEMMKELFGEKNEAD